jgi:adenylyltransferase/sulfurtransferase
MPSLSETRTFITNIMEGIYKYSFPNCFMDLNKEEMERYSRHMLMDGIGKEGQLKLKRAKVLVVGAGGLGTPAAIYLASSGVGFLGIADSDKVERSNMPRQVLFRDGDEGRGKGETIKSRLERINPFVRIKTFSDITEKNAKDVIKDFDVVVEGSDSLDTKLLVNKACIEMGKPMVFGAVIGAEGQLAVFHKQGCMKCIFKEEKQPSSCSEDGVVSTVPGIVGLLQAMEAVKIILGKPVLKELLVYDGMKTEFKKIKFRKDPKCKVCSG